MRRRLALLVVATTSLVLLAFLAPLAVLIDRSASDRAITEAEATSQQLVPQVAAADNIDTVVRAVGGLTDPELSVSVLMPDRTLVGERQEGVRLPESTLTATKVREQVDARVVLDQPVFRDDGVAVISTVISRSALDRGVRRSWAVLALLGIVLIGLSLLVADRLARSMTVPISALAATAEQLGRGELDAQVEPAGPPEIREVGAALNRLAARIRELLVAERESVADLSHRLRTPVTALHLDAEGLADPEERSRLVAGVVELTRQVDAVIREARRPVREGAVVRCDARAVVAARLAFWRVLAKDQQRELRADLPPVVLPVRASEPDLAALVDALLGNVFAHTEEGVGMAVAVQARTTGGADLTVSDGGTGFDADALSRGESGSGSTGLGLDIARRTAVASGGDILVRQAPDGGAEVVVHLGPPA